MSLNVAAVQAIFKALGKGIFLSGLITTHVAAYEQLMMALAAQENGGTANDFNAFQTVIVPAYNAIKGVVAKVQTGTATAQNINENYLQLVVAAQLALDSSSAISDILDGLRAQMIANGQYITSGGTLDTYIRSVWTYNNIPIAGTSLIPDSYVTSTVI